MEFYQNPSLKVGSLAVQVDDSELRARFERSLNRFISIARSFFKERLDAIAVFGSMVDPSKKLKPDSDIDLVVFHRASEEEVVLFHRLLPTERRRRVKEVVEEWSWYYDEPLKHDVENDVYWHVFYVETPRMPRVLRRLGVYKLVYVNPSSSPNLVVRVKA